MKEGKKVLSVQIDEDIYLMLKAICEHEDRSQAKIVTYLIRDKHKALKLK